MPGEGIRQETQKIGKTTLLRGIVNLHVQESGTVELQGENVTRVPAHRIVRRGWNYVPDYRGILRSLTLKENLWTSNVMLKDQAAFHEELESIVQLFPNLKYRFTMAAGPLSGGEHQMLAIARALMHRPRILLIDEPLIGPAPLLVEEIFQKLRALTEKGMPVQTLFRREPARLKASREAISIRRKSMNLELTKAQQVIKKSAYEFVQAALDHSLKYAKGRVQFGKPISKNQVIAFMLADMQVNTETARLHTYHAAGMKDQKEPHETEATIAKLVASERADKNVMMGFQIHGGCGFIKEYEISRLYRHVKILEIDEGASEICRPVISRSMGC